MTSISFSGNRFDQKSLDMLVQLPAIKNKANLNYKNYSLRFVPRFLPDSKTTKLNLSQNKLEDSIGLSAVFSMK